jgi:hypothetical protein
MYEAMSAYEEARLWTTVDPEQLDGLMNAYYEAEGAYWEKRHIITELSA